MIDSHCHLNVDDYREDLDEVVARARDAGVHGILVPGIGLESCERALEIAERHPMVRVAVGIHPHEALAWDAAAERRLRAWAERDEVVAIGEIGLDFYRDWSPFDAQRVAYAAQLRLARELDLPVIIHDRQAHEEVLAGVEAVPGSRGVMHCFSGGPAEAERAVAAGFHLSFTGTLTFGKGKADRVLKRVPPERLLLETDSPYMTPVPHRGERNEPAFVTHVADALSEKLEWDRAEVLASTSRAAAELFGFPPEPAP
ncbi:MAG: TatD family hydrolase [bacterium]